MQSFTPRDARFLHAAGRTHCFPFDTTHAIPICVSPVSPTPPEPPIFDLHAPTKNVHARILDLHASTLDPETACISPGLPHKHTFWDEFATTCCTSDGISASGKLSRGRPPGAPRTTVALPLPPTTTPAAPSTAAPIAAPETPPTPGTCCMPGVVVAADDKGVGASAGYSHSSELGSRPGGRRAAAAAAAAPPRASTTGRSADNRLSGSSPQPAARPWPVASATSAPPAGTRSRQRLLRAARSMAPCKCCRRASTPRGPTRTPPPPLPVASSVAQPLLSRSSAWLSRTPSSSER
eukprot:351666-Chlamydomonas_euryale.AAC.7